MTRFATVFALLAPACVVYDTDGLDGGPVNGAPFFTYADAGCYPDDHYRDYIWYFDADIDDPDGYLDVVEVWADVYDTWDGSWQDGFELYPEQGVTWFSHWLGSSTWLDCHYGGYLVDFTAYDAYGAYDVVSLYPATW